MMEKLMSEPTHLREAPSEAKGPELTTEEARQGETSGHMRIVLAVSLSSALIALIGIYLYYIA